MPTHETSALVEIEIFHVHWQFARSLFLAFLTAQGLKDQPKRPPQAAAVPRQPPARHSDTRSCPSASPLPPRRVSRPARTSSPGPSSPFLVSPDPPGQLQFRHRWPLASFSALPHHPSPHHPSGLQTMAGAGSQWPASHTTPRSTPAQRFEQPGGARTRGEKGATLGDYRIVKTLGEGSFGKVRCNSLSPIHHPPLLPSQSGEHC
jgi:hypothetical protein